MNDTNMVILANCSMLIARAVGTKDVNAAVIPIDKHHLHLDLITTVIVFI